MNRTTTLSTLLQRSPTCFNYNQLRFKCRTWLQMKEHKTFVPQLNYDQYGQPKGSPHVQERFFRLGWGGYLHPQMERRLFTYKKPAEQNYREDQHVMTSNRRAKILDKMCDNQFKKRLYLVDPRWKIYDNYHKRWNMNHIPNEETNSVSYP